MDAGFSPFVLAVTAPRDRFIEEHDRYLEIMRRVADSGASAPSDS
jgi:hypothetical protein